MPVAGSLELAILGVVPGSLQAVLGREQRLDVDAGLEHDIHVAPALAVETGVVGDEADALARQRRELLPGQNVQAGQNLGVSGDHAPDAGAGQRLVVAGQADPRRVHVQPRGNNGGHTAAQRDHRRPAFGMHAVREQDHVGVGGRVNPQRSAGEPGVAVGADREQLAASASNRENRCPIRGRAVWAGPEVTEAR